MAKLAVINRDKKRRETAETRNTAEQLVYSIEKLIKDNEDKLPDDVKTEVKDGVEELKKALEGEDADTIKAASEKLAQSSQKMGAAMYANAQAAGGGSDESTGSADSSTAQDDDVVDAEIVDDDARPQDKPSGQSEGDAK